MSLKALALNGTLKSSDSSEASSTGKLLELIAEEFKKHGVETDTIRLADQNIKPGVTSDEGEGDTESDQVFEVNGVRLLVDPISLRYLNGAEVDFVDNNMGGGFTIKNPNAKSTCGCGSSFNV